MNVEYNKAEIEDELREYYKKNHGNLKPEKVKVIEQALNEVIQDIEEARHFPCNN
jgi:hypothetical protein